MSENAAHSREKLRVIQEMEEHVEQQLDLLTPIETIFAAIFMLGAMLAIVQFGGKIKLFTKRKFALNKV